MDGDLSARWLHLEHVTDAATTATATAAATAARVGRLEWRDKVTRHPTRVRHLEAGAGPAADQHAVEQEAALVLAEHALPLHALPGPALAVVLPEGEVPAGAVLLEHGGQVVGVQVRDADGGGHLERQAGRVQPRVAVGDVDRQLLQERQYLFLFFVYISSIVSSCRENIFCFGFFNSFLFNYTLNNFF